MSALFGSASRADFVQVAAKSNLGGQLLGLAGSVHLRGTPRSASKVGKLVNGQNEIGSRSNFSAEICWVHFVLQERFIHLAQLCQGEFWFAEAEGTFVSSSMLLATFRAA